MTALALFIMGRPMPSCFLSGNNEAPHLNLQTPCLVGTSGWNYKHWKGRFYPDYLRPAEWLGFYAQHFSTVEINTTHYHLPSVESFHSWYARTPADFTFAVKASRYITHMKKLRDVAEPLDLLLQRVRNLGEKLGPILYQLPSFWHVDLERLDQFLQLLPSGLNHVFEFRHQSWLNEQVYSLLRRYKVSLCLIALPGFESPIEVTAPLVYIRMHGAAIKYGDKFPMERLEEWAILIRRFLKDGHQVLVYFNNDAQAFAVENARELRGLVDRCS